MAAVLQNHPPTTRLPKAELYRFNVDQFRRMTDAHVLYESDDVELLEGALVRKGTF